MASCTFNFNSTCARGVTSLQGQKSAVKKSSTINMLEMDNETSGSGSDCPVEEKSQAPSISYSGNNLAGQGDFFNRVKNRKRQKAKEAQAFKGYPDFPVDERIFPARTAPREGWAVKYSASQTMSNGKSKITAALYVHTSGPSALPGYLDIFAGPGDHVVKGWETTLKFDRGTDSEFAFVTADTEDPQPLRNLQAVSNALFVKKVHLLAYWEFFKFNEKVPFPDHFRGTCTSSSSSENDQEGHSSSSFRSPLPAAAVIRGKKGQLQKGTRKRKSPSTELANTFTEMALNPLQLESNTFDGDREGLASASPSSSDADHDHETLTSSLVVPAPTKPASKRPRRKNAGRNPKRN